MVAKKVMYCLSKGFMCLQLQKKRFAVLVHYMSQLEGELDEEAGPNGDDSATLALEYPAAQ